MSGGGRCNFTNTGTGPANFLSRNPHFCKSALARYRPADFIDLVERHGIAYHEKELGQLFCDESSKQIVKLLLDECDWAGVHIATGIDIRSVRFDGDRFEVETAQGMYRAEKLVVATGGLSIPSMGASGLGYQIARQFGHALIETRAGLVPFTLSGKPLEQYAELAGLALPVAVRAGGAEVRTLPGAQGDLSGAQTGRWRALALDPRLSGILESLARTALDGLKRPASPETDAPRLWE